MAIWFVTIVGAFLAISVWMLTGATDSLCVNVRETAPGAAKP